VRNGGFDADGNGPNDVKHYATKNGDEEMKFALSKISLCCRFLC